MRKAIIVIAILLLSNSSEAQWHQIAKFMSTNDLGNQVVEDIGLIYFLDLPGPSRIGFEGYDVELWKTTDGGATWFKSWDPAKEDPGFNPDFLSISFIDSLNGWFNCSTSTSFPVCWRTTDAGNSWHPQYAQFKKYLDNGIGGSINYFRSTGRLFLTLDQSDDTEEIGGLTAPYGYGRLVVSTDSGNTWQIVPGFDSVVHIYNSYLNDTQMFYYRGFGEMSLWSDSQGIVLSTITALDSESAWGPFFTTMNGGLTWHEAGSLPDGNGSTPPFAIPGTSICFATTFNWVYRSDDYGQTWRKLYQFSSLDSDGSTIGTVCYGISGDLSHLIVDSDSSLFLSTDEGKTWVNGGITYDSDNPQEQYLPYAAIYNGVYEHGKIFAGKTDEYDGVSFSDGLWEEDWPQASGVAEVQAQPDSCFAILGPYSNPSAPGANDVSILVHYCGILAPISAQVYTALGAPVGGSSLYTSDGQIWDRVPILSPGTAGAYYVVVTVSGYSSMSGFSVY